MKRLLLILGAVILVAGGLMAPAFAQETGEVTVTAEPAQVSVMVTPDTVGYGTVEIGATDLMLVHPEPDRTIAAINTGNCWVDFLIMGADTTNWALGNSPEYNIYVHKFGWPPPGPYTPLTKNCQDLYEPVWMYEPGCVQPFKLRMDTPTSTTYFGVQATTVTVLAVWVEKGITADLAIDAPSYLQGTPTATLTMTVINENDAPLTGLPPEAFFTIWKPAGGFMGAVDPQPTFTETDPGVSGIYEATLDISGLALGTYDVSVDVLDTIYIPGRKACGMQSFVIE